MQSDLAFVCVLKTATQMNDFIRQVLKMTSVIILR